MPDACNRGETRSLTRPAQPGQPTQKTLTVGQTSANTITQGTMVQDISTHSEL